jgi:hypothetical protein
MRRIDLSEKRIPKSFLPVMAVVLLMLLFALAAPSAKAIDQAWYPPYSATPFYGKTPQGVGNYHYHVFIEPKAYASSGKAEMYIGSHADPIGSCRLNAWAGFSGPSFVADGPQVAYVYYNWKLWYQAGVTTGINLIPTSAYWEMNIKIYGNLRDVTTGSWVLQNDQVLVAFSQSGFCTAPWQWHVDAQFCMCSFTCNLVQGHTYQFKTYVNSMTYASATMTWSDTWINLGNNGNAAYLQWIYVSPPDLLTGGNMAS